MNDPIERATTLRRYLAGAVLFLLGCAAGYLLKGQLQVPEYDVKEQRQSGWEFINPLLECDEPEGAGGTRELRPIKRDVEQFIAKRLDRQRVVKMNIYFRQLKDGPWFIIGGAEEFHPASLLKLPLMIAVLKQAETDPSLLAKRVHIDDKTLALIPYPSEKPLLAGRTYTVDELLRHMIVHSDNVATFVLGNTVDPVAVSQTYADLGLINPYIRLADPSLTVASADYKITIRSYASFLRVLFNASYLSKAMSEKALRLLTETDFKTGLVAGVPAGIKVAHKWGTRLVGERQEIKQLHDCGIVYYPEHPYLICVMTSGTSLEHLDDAIGAISRAVYESIDRQHREPPEPLPAP